MHKKWALAIFVVAASMSGTASAGLISTAGLSFFIQQGLVTNNAGSDAAIETIVYDLGTADVGIATWDTQGNSGAAGGVASNFLSDPRWFQTVTFSGLNIAAGSSYSFASLDIDRIVSISPLSVSGALDTVGTSLANASFSVYWSDGSFGSSALVQQAWATDQNLTIESEMGTVPEPATLGLLVAGLAGCYARKKVVKSKKSA